MTLHRPPRIRTTREPVTAVSPTPVPWRRFAHRAAGAAPAVAISLSAGAASLAAPADLAAQGTAVRCEERTVTTGPGADDALPDALQGRSPTDLFCIDLHATARAGEAAGFVALGRVPSPFGVAVTPEGHHEYDLTAHISGLPDPATLGPYTTYVAWATTPVFDPVIRLGEVGNGDHALGRIALDKFLLMVSAEASPEGADREGPLILRGRSPSSLMEAHDLLATAPSALRAPGAGAHDHGGAGEDGWTMPPGYPGIDMLPGMMGVRPRVAPLDLEPPAWEDVPDVRPRQLVELPDGGTLDLEAGWVRREVEGRRLLMMGFNGQHPGPLIRVPEAATIFVNFTNRIPLPTSIHWHGLRLDNRFDGVPGVTQEPVEPGETFRYQVYFPDPGIYWYHPHHREDVQQELGLYGNMLVDAPEPDYWSPVNREEVLMLDDLLLGEEEVVPFGEASSNYMLMGRFGNVFLVNGEPSYELEVARGEVVRFYLTNVANTRTFNVSFVETDGAGAIPPGPDPRELPMKVVASDVGRFEREEMAGSAVLAPAERYVVEVRFDEPGTWALANRVQGIDHRQGVFRHEEAIFGTVTVTDRAAATDHGHHFDVLRENDEVVADIARYRERFDDPPDHELVLTLEVENLPEPVERSMLYDWIYFNPVEWTGTMPMMNWATSGEEVRWILRDAETGLENGDIDWSFRVGDVVKIRLHNDRAAFHAMQHPLHIHGQRFLVLERDGVPEGNRVWKDTVLLPTGSTTDILLELSNPGRWMVHCHIAEHLESGMKFVMDVAGEGGVR